MESSRQQPAPGSSPPPSGDGGPGIREAGRRGGAGGTAGQQRPLQVRGAGSTLLRWNPPSSQAQKLLWARLDPSTRTLGSTCWTSSVDVLLSVSIDNSLLRARGVIPPPRKNKDARAARPEPHFCSGKANFDFSFIKRRRPAANFRWFRIRSAGVDPICSRDQISGARTHSAKSGAQAGAAGRGRARGRPPARRGASPRAAPAPLRQRTPAAVLYLESLSQTDWGLHGLERLFSASAETWRMAESQQSGSPVRTSLYMLAVAREAKKSSNDFSVQGIQQLLEEPQHFGGS
ncbi:uncharacterized protein [Dipodomys merriami]|uniref:uncharacterized protein n=1 Tax=Dipodomys merriami TaxID=94247 RepID=UPI003855F0D0